MASSGRRRSRRPLGAQVGALRARWPAGNTEFVRGALTWTGPLQPSPLSAVYTVVVTYRAGWHRPRVTVLDPPLREPGVGRLPHVFPEDRLCLHYGGDWHEQMSIADTILPWAAEWLVHYELWKATGDWHGGGHDPAGEKAE
jgi:hypothetical protein